MKITETLFSLADAEYRAFQAPLIPHLPAESFIGVRTPAIKSLAKEIIGTPEADAFMQELPHTYFEENQLHSFIISDMKDYDSCLNEINRFLPYIDNWATCDQCSPKVFKKNTDQLIHEIKKWIQSDHPYTVRFAIKVLMNHYLKENYQPEYLDMVSNVSMEHYYVQMMQAWYFATALAHQYDDTLKILESSRLPLWVHNKTIQKAGESYRISDEQKEYLKQLKR
jgi:3-methyladenine DNA glycosylase AlkD